jgi:hypothetical protein
MLVSQQMNKQAMRWQSSFVFWKTRRHRCSGIATWLTLHLALRRKLMALPILEAHRKQYAYARQSFSLPSSA